MASLGSDPEDFLAAVRDSTSSISTQTRDLRGEGSWHRPLGQIKKNIFQVLLFVLHQSLDLCEHLLHQLARFGEPFGEQAVGVDLHQLTTFEEFPHPRVTSFIKTESG